MQGQGVLFGQVAVVFGIVIAGVWAATQWTAAASLLPYTPSACTAHALSALEPAAAVGRAADELVTALRTLRAAGAKAGTEVREALLALGHDHERMLDMEDIVVSRGAGRGPEMASAIAGVLRDIASMSGTKLDDYVQFNPFISCGETPATAIEAAVRVVASRLDVDVQP